MSYELIVFSGESNIPLRDEIFHHLNMPLSKIITKRFSDGEMFVKFEETIRGRDVFLIQSMSSPCNDNFMQLLLMLDAARRASAARITVVLPYYGYARQDRKSEPRVPITARLVSDLIEALKPNRMLCIDLHADQIQGFFQIPVDHLYAAPIFVEYLKKKYLENLIVVAPDSGGAERARFLARYLDVNLAIIDKRRAHANVSEVMNVIGEVKDKTCVIYDDIIDTAGTISNAAFALKNEGAKKVLVCATHAVLSGDAKTRLENSCIDEVIVTNTINVEESKKIKKLTILSVGKMISEAIMNIHNEKSVSSLFL